MTDYPDRQSTRLKGYDYSSEGFYFITICTRNRHCLLGKIVDDDGGTDAVGASRGSPVKENPREAPARVNLNTYGRIVDDLWQTIPDHHSVQLDHYVVMPNHLHGILILTGGQTGGSRPAPTTLGNVVGLFKSECTKKIRKKIKRPDFSLWQRNYYDRIIRNDEELSKIRRYIKDNPAKWQFDRNNPNNF